jgi:mannose-6-phosphate isomerase-like protein (cupin superfamily)
MFSPARFGMALPIVLALVVAGVSAKHGIAQDAFSRVTVEPRPEEYLHWDATAFAARRARLEARLEAGGGIWGTGFAFDRVIDDAPYRPHSMSIVLREGYTQPEIHQGKWDIYVILEGSGTVLMGGTRIGWIEGRPPEDQRPGLAGATAFHVTQGDIVHVPARVWHQLVLEDGQSILYALININEPEGTP